MPRRGECRVNAEIGGQHHRVNVDDIEIDTPVLSDGKIVKSNNSYARTIKGGGYVKHKKTDNILHSVEGQGVH